MAAIRGEYSNLAMLYSSRGPLSERARLAQCVTRSEEESIRVLSLLVESSILHIVSGQARYFFVSFISQVAHPVSHVKIYCDVLLIVAMGKRVFVLTEE